MRAMYRLYDAICFQDNIEVKHEVTYIWYQHTGVSKRGQIRVTRTRIDITS